MSGVGNSGATTSGSTRTLSEHASKQRLASLGVPTGSEHITTTAEEAVAAADALGYPVVAKLCGDTIAHKTERGLVRLGLSDAAEVRLAANDLLAAATPQDGAVAVLVAPMVQGSREFIAGLSRDPQFGMTVMIGVGGVLAEAVEDVAIRLVPITSVDANEMLEELRTQKLLGAFRDEPAVDRDELAAVLVALSDAAVADPAIVSVDLNPLIIAGGRPVAVDALVELEHP